MKEKFNASDAAARLSAFTPRPAGATLRRSSPLNNVVRVAIQAMAAVLAATQSLHNQQAYDEELGAAHGAQCDTRAGGPQQLLAPRDRCTRRRSIRWAAAF